MAVNEAWIIISPVHLHGIRNRFLPQCLLSVIYVKCWFVPISTAVIVNQKSWQKITSLALSRQLLWIVDYYYYTRLTASFPGQPGQAGTRKVKPVWIKMSQEMLGFGMQCLQLDHVQTICTWLQTDNHANTSSLDFCRPDALSDSQPTVSKHWRYYDT